MSRLADEPSNKLKLRNMQGLLELFRVADSEMPVQQMLVLVWTALNEGKSQRDMRLALDMPSSTASRNLNALSKYHRLGKPGLHYIELEDDPADRRQKLLFLTPKGKTFVGQLMGKMGD